MEAADFKSLIALSQEHQIPAYALPPEFVGVGLVWERAKASMTVFEEAFHQYVEKVIALTV